MDSVSHGLPATLIKESSERMKPHLPALLLLLFLGLLIGCGSNQGTTNALEGASEEEVQNYLDMVAKEDAQMAGQPDLGRNE